MRCISLKSNFCTYAYVLQTIAACTLVQAVEKTVAKVMGMGKT